MLKMNPIHNLRGDEKRRARPVKDCSQHSIQPTHSEHFDRLNTGVTNNITNGWIPLE